jgi:anti-sigma B factor antagonist
VTIASSTVTVEHSDADGVVVLKLLGELDLTNAVSVETALDRASAPAVIVDLGGLSFIDSAGMRVIDRANRRLAESDRMLVIVAPTDSAAGWMLKIAGVAESVVADSLEQARRHAATREPGTGPEPRRSGEAQARRP